MSFLLTDEGLLIAQPATFGPALNGWWYCDLVTIDDHGDTVTIEDLYIDVLVGPPTAPYRLLDLDELATAVSAGTVPLPVALAGLDRCQRFLDGRLNRRHSTEPTWPDFPPPQTRAALWHTLPTEWQ